MWREFISGFKIDCTFFLPASKDQLKQIEDALGVELPDDLRGLLSESNGVMITPAFPGYEGMDLSTDLIWPADEILKENIRYREVEPEFTSFLLFASQPNGDPLAFPITDGVANRSSIALIPHDDVWSNRRVIADSLEGYLDLFLGLVAEQEQCG